MRTFRDILRQEEERQNLKQVGFCVLAVFVLVMGAFSLVAMKQLFGTQAQAVQGEWASTEHYVSEYGP